MCKISLAAELDKLCKEHAAVALESGGPPHMLPWKPHLLLMVQFHDGIRHPHGA